MTRWAFLLAAVLMPIGQSAHACSMVPGYKVPTSLELAAAAETIVVAKVVGERQGEKSYNGTVLLRPVALLKGSALPPSVDITGASLSRDPRMVIASNARELRRANPGALIGGCVRYTFLPDATLLLFLKRDEAGNLVPYRSSFSRDAEDVVNEDSLWSKVVREYAAISTLPRKEWKAELKRRIALWEAKVGDPDATAIATDLKIELSGKRLPPYD